MKTTKYLNTTITKGNNKRINIIPIEHEGEKYFKIYFTKYLKGEDLKKNKRAHKKTMGIQVETNRAETKGYKITELVLSEEATVALYISLQAELLR